MFKKLILLRLTDIEELLQTEKILKISKETGKRDILYTKLGQFIRLEFLASSFDRYFVSFSQVSDSNARSFCELFYPSQFRLFRKDFVLSEMKLCGSERFLGPY